MKKLKKRVLLPLKNEPPYLISVATRNVGDKYLASAKILGSSVEMASVWVDSYPGHMRRIDEIESLNLDPMRWWIFTDTADVTFQRPFPDFSTFKPGIIVCDEGTTHTNEFWEYFIQMYPIFTYLKRKEVYNCGTVAMPGYLFLEYIKYFKNYRNNYLPQGCPQMLEQLIFNSFVQKYHEYSYSVESLFAALCSNYFVGTAIKGDDGIWVDRKGKPFVVVHKNGETKEL